MAIPKLLTLREAAEMLGSVSVKALRKEVQAGRLRCYRSRPGCTSKILVSEQNIEAWLASSASQRQRVPSVRARADA